MEDGEQGRTDCRVFLLLPNDQGALYDGCAGVVNATEHRLVHH